MLFRSNRKQKVTADKVDTHVPLNVSIIQADSVITGSVKAACNIRIDGAVYGDIYTNKKIIINEHALIHGNVEGENIDVKGKVKGDIISTKIIHLYSTAWIKGSLKTPTLTVDEGARLNGNINTGS